MGKETISERFRPVAPESAPLPRIKRGCLHGGDSPLIFLIYVTGSAFAFDVREKEYRR